jgi:hypothetical protein
MNRARSGARWTNGHGAPECGADKRRGLGHTAGMSLPRRPAAAHRPRCVAHGLLLLVFAPLVAFAQVGAEKTPPLTSEAALACEQAVRDAVADRGAPSTEVTFTAASIDKSLSNESQLVLRGSGRARGASGAARTFSFGCNIDAKSGDVIGLMLRDAIAVAARPDGPARAPAEPDLSNLSPAACESSAAQALKQRWPRVSQISFDPETRSFSQDSDRRAALHGRGRALPAPDEPATLFGFDCEIDPRDGRVLATRLSG